MLHQQQQLTKAVDSGERIHRAAKFAHTVACIISSYYSTSLGLFFRKVMPANHHLTEEEEKLTWNKQHAMGAEALSKIINSMQGFYVKAAQVIASRPDSIP
jgi:predicted unusual protein kinase regulating ubiquinone biosynthesis (AarF/ABC1/UbiB family)